MLRYCSVSSNCSAVALVLAVNNSLTLSMAPGLILVSRLEVILIVAGPMIGFDLMVSVFRITVGLAVARPVESAFFGLI